MHDIVQVIVASAYYLPAENEMCVVYGTCMHDWQNAQSLMIYGEIQIAGFIWGRSLSSVHNFKIDCCAMLTSPLIY